MIFKYNDFNYEMNNDKLFILINYKNLNEDIKYLSKTHLDYKDLEELFPLGKEVKYTQERIIRSVEYGMILEMGYKGYNDKMDHHERMIYPMVLGINKSGKELLRGYHLSGYSVSEKAHIRKVWRLFRADRIKFLKFTGQFFRMPPKGYNMEDSSMKKGIIASADFNIIRQNQTKLKDGKLIENVDTLVKSDSNNPKKIIIEKSNNILNLKNISKDNKEFLVKKFTIAKNLIDNNIVFINNFLAEKNSYFYLYDNHNKNLGKWKIIKSVLGSELGVGKIDNIENKEEFDLYTYIKNKL